MSIQAKNTGIPATTEILGCFVSEDCAAEELNPNPKSYIRGKYDVGLAENMDVAVVQNSDDTMHLALPYYDGLQNPETIERLDAYALEDVSGGEIISTIFVVALLGVGSAVAVAGVGAGIGVSKSNK